VDFYFIQTIKWTLFTWGMTAAGAALVFTHKSPPRKFLDMMLGFAGGVMTAASYFSLLRPSRKRSFQNLKVKEILIYPLLVL